MFSYIQQLILINLLKSSDGLRYSEACPKDTEDNLYHYHLQTLIKRGIVEYKDSLYRLTEKGKSQVQQFDAEGRTKDFFKVGVLPYVIRKLNGEKKYC